VGGVRKQRNFSKRLMSNMNISMLILSQETTSFKQEKKLKNITNFVRIPQLLLTRESTLFLGLMTQTLRSILADEKKAIVEHMERNAKEHGYYLYPDK